MYLYLDGLNAMQNNSVQPVEFNAEATDSKISRQKFYWKYVEQFIKIKVIF